MKASLLALIVAYNLFIPAYAQEKPVAFDFGFGLVESPQGEKTMSTVTLEEAQANLPQLIETLHAGEEIVITRDRKPLARLVGETKIDKRRPQLGTLKGTVLYTASDFDAPLEDFKEYMQ